jgi:tetratricopeptide (TPR) repeat protein
MGLVGLAVFGWILLSFFKLGLQIIKNHITSCRKMQIAGSLAGVFGLLVYSFYDFNLHIPSNAVAFIILFATVPAFLISHDPGIKNKFQINLKLNLFSRIVIFLIGIYFITFIASSIIKPHLAYLHYEKGQVFEEALDWDKAIEEYNKAKGLDPTDSSYYYALGKIYTARAQFEFLDQDYVELTINNYNKAIRLNPQQGEYYLALGIFYNILGNRELASDNLNKALSLDPTNQYYHSAFDILLNK